MKRKWLALTLLFSAFAFAARVEIRVLSGRADMVTGGDALVETNAGAQKFHAELNGRDITGSFKPGASADSSIARIEGLKDGKNLLEIKSSKGSAKLELTNFPSAGPVFSGPHQKPFVCQTEQAGLGAPLDDDCSVKTVVSYVYKSTVPPPPGRGRGQGPGALPAGFKAFDPSGARPSDLAQTTVNGKTVDYIVRRERGTINRAIYEIAMIADPGASPDPWKPSAGWNGRLVYSFGGELRGGLSPGPPRRRDHR